MAEKRAIAYHSPAGVKNARSQHHRLLARIHRRYRTLTDTIDVAGRAYAFTRIADPNRVLDQIADAEDRIEKRSGRRKEGNHLHLPYWAELWDSALGMGTWLKEETRRQGDKVTRASHPPSHSHLVTPSPSHLSVLDLGCGMGFTGMIAASLGHDVTFADLEPPALLFAKLNSLTHTPSARTRQLDWQTARLAERFDLILGADILYERKQWDHLEPFWRAHVAPAGRVLLGEPGRQTGDDFPAWIVARGWKIAFHEQPVQTRTRPIRLFEIRLT